VRREWDRAARDESQSHRHRTEPHSFSSGTTCQGRQAHRPLPLKKCGSRRCATTRTPPDHVPSRLFPPLGSSGSIVSWPTFRSRAAIFCSASVNDSPRATSSVNSRSRYLLIQSCSYEWSMPAVVPIPLLLPSPAGDDSINWRMNSELNLRSKLAIRISEGGPSNVDPRHPYCPAHVGHFTLGGEYHAITDTPASHGTAQPHARDRQRAWWLWSRDSAASPPHSWCDVVASRTDSLATSRPVTVVAASALRISRGRERSPQSLVVPRRRSAARCPNGQTVGCLRRRRCAAALSGAEPVSRKHLSASCRRAASIAG